MDWYNVKSKLPTAFVPVLCYIPSLKPLPTVHEGYVNTSGMFFMKDRSLNEHLVTHWADMPEYPE